MEKTRLETLSDGVFAIVITLLILDVRLPSDLKIFTEHDLEQGFYRIIPRVVAYILSFCIIGIFWSAHVTIFHLIKWVDKKTLWLNIIYLMIIAFIPFPTMLLALYPDKQIVIILYSFNLGIAGVFHRIILNYIYANHNVGSDIFTEKINKAILFPSLFGPVCYIFSILFSFFSLYLSYLLFLTVLLYYIFFNEVEGRKPKGK